MLQNYPFRRFSICSQRRVIASSHCQGHNLISLITAIDCNSHLPITLLIEWPLSATVDEVLGFYQLPHLHVVVMSFAPGLDEVELVLRDNRWRSRNNTASIIIHDNVLWILVRPSRLANHITIPSLHSPWFLSQSVLAVASGLLARPESQADLNVYVITSLLPRSNIHQPSIIH